jgi:EPS-associated MarR family transcriptional regulator
MIEQPPKEDILSIIKELEANPNATQRILSKNLNISLGKTNYLLKELIKKGLIKVKNFSSNPGKMQKIHYYLTKRGIEEKMRLMFHFLKRKETEYSQLKKEWDRLAMKRVKESAVSIQEGATNNEVSG